MFFKKTEIDSARYQPWTAWRNLEQILPQHIILSLPNMKQSCWTNWAPRRAKREARIYPDHYKWLENWAKRIVWSKCCTPEKKTFCTPCTGFVSDGHSAVLLRSTLFDTRPSAVCTARSQGDWESPSYSFPPIVTFTPIVPLILFPVSFVTSNCFEFWQRWPLSGMAHKAR